FLVLSRDATTHLHLLARLGQMIRVPEFLQELRATESPLATLNLIRKADEEISQRGTRN
ncbi:MAG: hypothetical protein HUJ26_04230, partial [Planctomycetaceae bacterium]|nr:hypothetical protein [Planctomycetaceae bacterium]